MLIYFGTYLFIMLAVGFFICAYDKRAAITKKRRVSEAALFATAMLGGSPGVFAAMLITRHKTQKRRFMIGIPIIMILQAALAIYLIKIL